MLLSLYQSFGDSSKSTNYNWYHRHFHVPQFFQYTSKIYVPILLFLSLNFTLWSAGTAKFTVQQVFFFAIIIRSGRLDKIRWSACISKSQKSLCVSFSRFDARVCIYHSFLWSNFNFLHNSQLINLLIQSCLVLYSFCANLLHSLIMRLTISSLSPHNLHLLFCCLLRGAFNKFPTFFVQTFKIVVDSWKFSMLFLYILWDDWPIFMIQMNSYSSNWNTPYYSPIVTAGEFQKCNLDVRTF